jgi:hypothetical protein
VSWPQRDDLAPAHSGFNERLDQQPMLRGQCAKEKVKFVRGDCACLRTITFGTSV